MCTKNTVLYKPDQFYFLFLQLYEVFCKYAKEHPNLGMTPTEFAEFLHKEQEASRMWYFSHCVINKLAF